MQWKGEKLLKENGRSGNQKILVSSRMEKEDQKYVRLKQNEVETKKKNIQADWTKLKKKICRFKQIG
jgi:hypothetical protein